MTFDDYAFSKLRERYKVWTGNSMEDKLFDSFEIRNEHRKLTNAGALLTIYSPDGMADGTRIQERDISNVSSTRRNPVLADIFGRLGYMERQGSGFKKITDAYYAAHNYREELAHKFYSDAVSFQVTLYNLNYKEEVNETYAAVDDEKITIREGGTFANTPKASKHQNEALNGQSDSHLLVAVLRFFYFTNNIFLRHLGI